ncbi:unnamed protein product [Vitrella brassicaformis CCMP3155]|uniref:Uncharacterized protein n=1 Tax=Vitrella brassicaformis (strain CCMP3155) TaxID=1169540 RepID=A0A0G4G016_VITBC|nr:unnamed protein product [Vitrella brassicaformis CCMP3155]|eukprot:CEM20847.1 unnamed protein product [Vitrella brassicaformis CCMP3155]
MSRLNGLSRIQWPRKSQTPSLCQEEGAGPQEGQQTRGEGQQQEQEGQQQLNPFNLPDQGSLWPKERGEKNNESSSESNDENEDWERCQSGGLPRIRSMPSHPNVQASSIKPDQKSEETYDEIEEGQAEDERPSKIARVMMETDLSRLGEGEGGATMADTISWMERMEE